MGQDILIYPIGESLYVNLTNRCTASCVFCRRTASPSVSGYDLRLDREHAAAEYIAAIQDPLRYAEIVFCGYGEPTLRLPVLLEIASDLKSRGARLRLNTNGHGNLIHGRNIVPDLSPLLDEISISINAPRRTLRTRSSFARISAYFPLMRSCDSVRSCVGKIPSVVLTAVGVPELDLDACREVARELKVELRFREYQPMRCNLQLP